MTMTAADLNALRPALQQRDNKRFLNVGCVRTLRCFIFSTRWLAAFLDCRIFTA